MSAIELQLWQKNYVADTARRKFLAASVQVGKSFAAQPRSYARLFRAQDALDYAVRL